MEQKTNHPAFQVVEPREPSPWRSLGSVAGALLAECESRRADAVTPPLVAWAAE